MEIVFVHGALVRDGAWWWQPAAELIEKATGVTSRAVRLPSCVENGADAASAGLLEDAEALQSVLDQLDSAIVVAHSYGGTVAAQGAGHPVVRHLLYISSYLPDVGQFQAEITGGEPNPLPIRDNEDGTVSVGIDDPTVFGDRFWDDVSDASLRAGAWDRLTAQSVAAFGTPTTEAAWQSIESTYLVCAGDRSTSRELQQFHAARATRSVELATSHHPFLSRPDLVAEQVAHILRSA
jgi:pimeloyl-ACP methyl ester carboxylesterase